MRSHALGVSGAGGRRKSGLPGLEGVGCPAGKVASTLESHVHADAECFGWETAHSFPEVLGHHLIKRKSSLSSLIPQNHTAF